jgi:predicted transcriptional regulator
MTETYKMYRTDSDNTSIEAANSIDVTKLEAIVWAVIDRFGTGGCIQDEVLEELSAYRYNSISNRFKALVEKNLIVRCEMTRKGKSGRSQRVMMSKRFYDLEEITEEERQQHLAETQRGI